MTHIEKMKQWLEALEEAVHYTSAPVWSPSMTKECNEAIASLRQAIAEAEKQEPDKYAIDIECTKCGAQQSGILTVHTTPPQRTEQEPVIDKSAAIRIATALGWEPKREWVGLDHHDKKKFSSWLDHKSDDEVFTAIEALLKEMNT